MKDRIETYTNEERKLRNYARQHMHGTQTAMLLVHAGLRKEVVYQPRSDADRTTVARHDGLTSVQGQSGSFQRTVVLKNIILVKAHL